MNARAVPRPRARPHTFRPDPRVPPDHRGRLTCRCGSLEPTSVHRERPARPVLYDWARLSAGERDDDDD